MTSAPDPFERYSRVPGANVVGRAVDSALRTPTTAVRAHVESLRRRNPEASPAQILTILEKEYLTVLQTLGGAVGGTAAIPAVGTAAAATLTAADVAAFFAASAAFTLAVAEVHGVEVEDTARRRTLLMATVLGEDGSRAFSDAGVSPVGWGKVALAAMPATTIQRVNKVLTGRFVKRYLLKHTGVLLGRLVPFGIGAAVGVIGGRALGRGVITQAATAFGPPPTQFPASVRVVEASTPDDAPLLASAPEPRPDGGE